MLITFKIKIFICINLLSESLTDFFTDQTNHLLINFKDLLSCEFLINGLWDSKVWSSSINSTFHHVKNLIGIFDKFFIMFPFFEWFTINLSWNWEFFKDELFFGNISWLSSFLALARSSSILPFNFSAFYSLIFFMDFP